MLLLCIAIINCDNNQNIIKNFALIVVGKNIPNGTKTNNFALGNK